MSRNRIKYEKGILEFSTNPYRNILAKRLIVEVVSKGFNKISHAYNVLDVRTC